MHGTHFAQFATEVLHRGAAAVLPQHLPDRWLDALLEEADLLAPEEGDPEEATASKTAVRASWVPCSWSSWTKGAIQTRWKWPQAP